MSNVSISLSERTHQSVLDSIDCEAFARDLASLRAGTEASLGPEDLQHFRKIERWGRGCSLLGYATAWLAPNPLSALLIAQGSTTRWTTMAHHALHRGYDRVSGTPTRLTGSGFASGWRRFIDWPEWIHPEAWRHEHNVMHHGRTGEREDPDLVEERTQWLRRARVPMPLKYAAVALMACTWRLTYYAPNTFLEWRRSERKRAGVVDLDMSRVRTVFDPRHAEGRAFWRMCLLPYAALRFALLPLLFAPLGAWAVLNVFLNSLLAEALTNLQTFFLIVPNHAGEDLYRFEGRAANHAEFCVRQVIGSVNYTTGSDPGDFLHGWLNYQIEHHLWPNLTLRAYQRLQPRVKALCEKHGVPYVQESLWRRAKKLIELMVGRTSMRTSLPPMRPRGSALRPAPGPMPRPDTGIDSSAILKTPRVAWGSIALFTGLLAAWSGGLVAGMGRWLPTPIAVASSMVGAFAAFTIMHDASHHAVSRLRWLNSLLGHASASLLLVRFVGFREVHRRHHRFAGDPRRDPDRYSGEGPWWQLPVRWATADLHYVFEQAPRGGVSRRDELEACLSAIALSAAILGLLLTGHAIDFLLFWLLPARIALFLLAYCFDYVPHQRPHCLATSESPYRASFVIEGRLMTVLLLCQNYHLVHHLYPGVPFYRYPGIWRARREELLARGAKIVSLFGRPRPPGSSPRGP